MGEHEWDRDECRIWDQEECEDRIAEDIFETWSPTLSKHFFKYRNQSRCHDRTEFWTGIIQHVERDRELGIRWVKKDDIVRSRFWYIREYRICEVSVRVDETHSTT